MAPEDVLGDEAAGLTEEPARVPAGGDELQSVPTDAEENLEDEAGGSLDPVSRLMVRLVLLMIIVVLSTTGAMLYFLSSLNKAPRTVVERDLSAWEVAVNERPEDIQAWRELAYAYARAGRMDDALETVREAGKVTGKDVFTSAEADLLRASGRYAEAVAAYDRAEKDLLVSYEEALDRRQRGQLKGFPDKTALGTVYHGRGVAKRELGDAAGALADFQQAVEAIPNQVILLTDLGDAYRLTGNGTKAREAFQQALRFAPDHQPALEGLRALGGDGDE